MRFDGNRAWSSAALGLLAAVLSVNLAGRAPVLAVTAEPSATGPILVQAEIAVDPALQLGAVDELPLVSLVDLDSNEVVLNLGWSKDRSSFFESWILGLSGEAVARTGQPAARSNAAAPLRLALVTPRPGTRYRAALSYDPSSGAVSVALTELPDERAVYRGHVGLGSSASEPAFGTLRAVAGRQGTTGGSPLVRTQVLEVHHAFVPVGIDWCMVDSAAPAACLTGATKTAEEIALRVRGGYGAPGSFFRLFTANGLDERKLLEFPASEGTHVVPIPSDELLPGRNKITLQYAHADGTWQLGVTYIDMAEATIGVFLDRLEFVDGSLAGVMTIESSADVEELGLVIAADLYTAPFRRDWQQVAGDVPVLTGPVSLRSGRHTHEFSVSLSEGAFVDKAALDGAPLVRVVPRVRADASRVRVAGKALDWFITFPEALLHTDAAEDERLREMEARGLLKIRPVVIPGDPALGENIHLGHPVAAMSGDSIVVVYYVRQYHYGGELRNGPSIAPGKRSSAMMVRSTDGGETWSAPVDMRTFGWPEVPSRVGFGNAIGTIRDGEMLLVTAYGAYVSPDGGASWVHYPQAFTDRQLSGPQTNNGPKVVDHPRYGPIVLGTMGFGTDEVALFKDEIWIRYSADGGKSWEEVVRTDLPPFAKPVEPTGVYLQGKTVVLARAHGGYHAATNTWRYVQIVLDEDLEVEDVRLTNIPATHRSGASGPWSQDTVDLALNPVTGRLEAVVTNRTGGEPGKEHDPKYQTLNLWSIDPAELLAGSAEWRFEATLLRRRRDDVPGVDGMHPGAAVIDEKNGVQRIYVYLGFGQGPSGIFEITRTLETDRLAEFGR